LRTVAIISVGGRVDVIASTRPEGNQTINITTNNNNNE
jgi:hypothetical protein